MSQPIKVLIACDTFAPDINGAAKFAERLAGGLVRNGNEVAIIAPSLDGWSGTRVEEHDGAKMTVHRLKSHKMPNHKSHRLTSPVWAIQGDQEESFLSKSPDALHIQSHLMVGTIRDERDQRNVDPEDRNQPHDA